MKPADIIHHIEVVTAFYLETRSSNGMSASNKGEFLYVATRNHHQRQPLKTMCKSLRVMERIASIQHGYHTFRKQKTNHCPPFLFGSDRQWSYHAERLHYNDYTIRRVTRVL
ncbi:hypothetical protein TNCV_4505461 [Trichonephila clavipes]|nr:hypothetical protein TNCV_4505461 [Trichonephila clavipes]